MGIVCLSNLNNNSTINNNSMEKKKQFITGSFIMKYK